MVGHETGNTGAGVAIGAASGAIVGGAVGAEEDKAELKSLEQEETLRRQQIEIQRQQRELEDIKRQQYHDQKFRKYEGGSSGDSFQR